MTRTEANAYLAMILEAAAVQGGAPSGVMYAALLGRLDLDQFQGLMQLAKDVGLVTEHGHVVSATAKGREMVAKIVAHRAAQVTA